MEHSSSVVLQLIMLNRSSICVHEKRELHHHQPINVPTAGAQAFLVDYSRRTGHNPPRGPSADWWVQLQLHTLNFMNSQQLIWLRTLDFVPFLF
jgi:hypothetical protein